MDSKMIPKTEDAIVAAMISRVTGASKHHLDYECVLATLAQTRKAKCQLYGESRYEEKDEEFDLWMCFSDVHRKYIRLRNLTTLARMGDDGAKKALLDCYADIANYGIMAVQIIGNQK